MQRVKRVYSIVLADDHHNSLSNGDKLWMRDIELAAIGHMNHERLETVHNFVLYPLRIHELTEPAIRSFVNLEGQEVQSHLTRLPSFATPFV